MRPTLAILFSLLAPQTTFAGDNLELHIDSMIKAAEVKYELPEGLLAALIHAESSGNHKAKVHNDGASSNTSYGLTQIQLDSARLVQRMKAKREKVKLNKGDLIQPSQLMIPEVNIDYGAAYLKWMLENHSNNIAWSLSCYNAGPNSFICRNKKYSPYVGHILNAYFTKKAK